MTSKKTRSKIFKVGMTIGLILFILFAGIQVFLSFYLNDLVENRLIDTVSEQTMNQYQLDVGELTLSVWNREMALHNVNIQPTNSSSTTPRVKFDQFSISGIQFLPYLLSGMIALGDVQFINPAVTLVENSPDTLTFLNRSNEPANQLKSLNITVDRFIIEDGTVIYQTQGQDIFRAEFHDFDLIINGVKMDSTSRFNPSFIDFETINTSTGTIRYAFKNGLYTLESHQTEYSTTQNAASIHSLQLIPQYPMYEFSKRVGHQIDRVSLTVAQLNLENLNIEELQNGAFITEKITIEDANLTVFKNKLLPDDPKRIKQFPQVTFQHLNLPVRIDTIEIQNGQISYGEHHPGISRPGTVSFTDIYGSVLNLTNCTKTVKNDGIITADITSNVMGSAKLNARFTFPVKPDGNHTVEGKLSTMRAADLNPILEPVGLIRAENGELHSLEFMMDMQPDSSSGWVELIYSDLNIAVLDSKDIDDGGKKWLKSVLANSLKIKSNNNKKPYRRGRIDMKRVHTKSIFSYWWKSLSTGLKDNIGL